MIYGVQILGHSVLGLTFMWCEKVFPKIVGDIL